MSHGIYINGRRPKSKKAVKDAIAAGERVTLESTSMFPGREHNGLVTEAADGRYDFVATRFGPTYAWPQFR